VPAERRQECQGGAEEGSECSGGCWDAAAGVRIQLELALPVAVGGWFGGWERCLLEAAWEVARFQVHGYSELG